MPMMGQTDGATITGTITDPSGRRVAGANFEIISNNTGLVRQTKTNEAGVYTLTSVNTGTRCRLYTL
jgi:protocatechuate 3,4-dioxygenase beta subunit